MKSLILSVGLLLIWSMSYAAFGARQKVDETKAAAHDGFVKVIVVRGRLKVEGWNQDKVRVTGLLDQQTKQFVFDVDKDKTTIEVRLSHGGVGGWWHSEGADLVVHVPADSHLKVSVVSADTSIEGIDGSTEAGSVSGDLAVDSVKHRVELTSVSGDVHLRRAAGRITAKSVSGEIDVYDSKGSFKLHSVSGDVTGHKVSDEFDLQSISGDIHFNDVSYKHIGGNSVSGDMDINGSMQPAGGLDLDSVSGSVRVAFSGDVDARFDLDAGSGSIHNGVSADKPAESKYSHDETLQFIKGNGKAEVNISTRSGDITLLAR